MDERKEFIIHEKLYLMFQHEIIISYFEGIQKILNKLPLDFPKPISDEFNKSNQDMIC